MISKKRCSRSFRPMHNIANIFENIRERKKRAEEISSRRIRTAEEERGLRTLSNFVFRVGEQFSWPRRSYRLHRRRTRHRRRCAQWVEYTVKRTSFMYNKLRLGIYVSSRLHLSATRPSSALLCVSLSLFPSFSSSATKTRTRKTEKGGDVERSRWRDPLTNRP